MKQHYWLALVAAAGMSLTAQAQGTVDGTWVGETQGRGGTQAVMLVLSVDGDTLTGTFTQGAQETDIEEGSIDGNTVTFQRTVGQVGFTLTYTGQVDDDTLTLTPTFEGEQRGGGRGRGVGQGRGGRGGGPQTLELTRQ